MALGPFDLGSVPFSLANRVFTGGRCQGYSTHDWADAVSPTVLLGLRHLITVISILSRSVLHNLRMLALCEFTASDMSIVL